jgi:hypothetical protein
MASDQDRDPGGGEPAGPGGPGQPGRDATDYAKAETYLRLRVEAELRRVQALPRPDPLEQAGVPPALRGPVRLGLRMAETLEPTTRGAARALRPVAGNAGRALRPVADRTARALQPLIENAAQTLRPLAENAGRTLEPLARRGIGTALPAVNRAAGRLHPLAWQAAARLRELAYPGGRRESRFRLAACEPGGPPSPEQGARRLQLVALTLTEAGAIEKSTATSIIAGLQTALVARSRIDAHDLFAWDLGARRHQVRAPAGRYIAAPIGALLPPAPGRGVARLFTLVAGPDRAVVTIAGRAAADHEDESLHMDPWPIFGADGPPAVTDDTGLSYELDEDSSWSSGDGEWSGMLTLTPIPAAAVQWLEIALRPDWPPVRVDLTSPGDAAGRFGPAPHPTERLFTAAALNLLEIAMIHDGPILGHPDLSDVADIVTALDAVGALEPARGAVGRLVALARRLGMPLPPALSAVAAAAEDLPGAWADILEHRHREDGPRADAVVAAMLPEIDGARFALAGLRSYPGAAELRVVSWGSQIGSHFARRTAANPWSWLARDDRDRWHLVTEGASSASDRHVDMQLNVMPPLHPDATSLDVTLTGPSAHVTVTVPLSWQEPA